ncbi:curlin associated repeat protein [Halanaerobium saccharolyticum]|uniref:Curlin associated repeat protein n=1 Tax=Halanaerobium saccharolyticum TaxID=43595 RepID=A0A4R6LTK9_9FIRM|nr:hypothetical protein [Halanaerobium saccharolyticum]TDO91276.1 curlin associated repeat protein [Halanaerobium saccharolyticum]
MLDNNKLIILAVIMTAVMILSGIALAQAPPGNPEVEFEYPGQGEFNGSYNPFLDEGEDNPGQDNGSGGEAGPGSGYFEMDQEAYIYQYGSHNQGAIYQSGRNRAGIKQFGSSNTAEINQHGENNIALIKQFGSDNINDIDQDGFNNMAFSAQYGQNNSSQITQNGDHNTAGVLQIGDNNQANIEQYGNGLDLEVMLGL